MIIYFLICVFFGSFLKAEEKFNFVTATDTEHYLWTLNLIGSIHQYHSQEQLGEIAIFDLGLTSEERSFLNTLEHTHVYPVEETNPYIFQKFITTNQGKTARGWYSWKPVIIKQSMEMFSDFFYLDSGITILKSFDILFKHVKQNGNFFVDCGHSIRRMTIKPLIEKFQLEDSILDAYGISSGIQGLSHHLYETYALPLYKLTFDIGNFQDDGSCPKGFGFARHDQTLFSIQARLLNLEVFPRGKLSLKIDNKNIQINWNDYMKISRANFNLNKTQPFLRYTHRE